LPLIPLFPLYAVFVVVVILPIGYLVTEGSRWARRGRLMRRMRKARRVMTWDEVELSLSSKQGGTLLLESPSMGWNDTDVWWTEEDVAGEAARAGIDVSSGSQPENARQLLDETPIEAWCRRRYVDSREGTGRLVQCTLSRHGRHEVISRIDALRARYPFLSMIMLNARQGSDLRT
jgi:hypothetical protein